MFQGHAAGRLLIDLVLGLIGFGYIFFIVWAEKTKNKIDNWIAWVFYFAATPNCAYLFLEGKHLLLKDGIADNPDRYSFAVFGGLSMLGLVLTVLCITVTVRSIPYLRNRWRLSTVFLSFLQAAGAAVGLLDVSSWEIVSNPIAVFRAVAHIATSSTWLSFILLLGAFITIVVITTNEMIGVHTSGSVE